MCTIGAVLNDKGLSIFKNCDLTKNVTFYKPKKRKGKYKYLGFTRKSRPGIWAGINEKGLGIVSADTYTKKNYKARPWTINKIFQGNEKVISKNKNVKQAIHFLKSKYKNEIKDVPDLIILGDKNNIAVFEFTPPDKFGVKIKEKGYVLRTNQFQILKGGMSRKEDPQSYKRFDRAKELIGKSTNLNSIKSLCKDHKNGPSKFSICRHGKNNEYKTQASAIMTHNKNTKAYYVKNNYPCKEKYKKVKL